MKSNALLLNQDHLRLLRQGTEAWVEWRAENTDKGPQLCGCDLAGKDLRTFDFRLSDLRCADLRAADLRGADLRGADLRQADLSRANLGHAYLSGADLRMARLHRANLSRADLVLGDLSGADLSGADLGGADLSKADLRRAVLHRVNLAETDLTDAILGWTSFGDVDLRDTRGLPFAVHLGPSSLGVDTIRRSRGELSEEFLGGVGLPESVIALIPSIAASSDQLATCLIGFAGADSAVAERLQTELQDSGVRAWLGPEDMALDKRIRQDLDTTVCLHDWLLLLVSQDLLQGQCARHLLELALVEEESRQRPFLVFILLDDALRSSPPPWAAALQNGRPLVDLPLHDDSSQYSDALDQLHDILTAL